MSSKSLAAQMGPVYRIPPFYYMHVLDQNTGVTRLEIGPQTLFKQDNENILIGPEKMITIPPRNYCIVENPAVKTATGQVQFDTNGQIKLCHATSDVRLNKDYGEPFPLYPGEILKQVCSNCDYHVCRLDFFITHTR
jgi:major vault protein